MHILWKLLISTKFQEICPQGYFFEGPVKYHPDPYIITGVSCPFSNRAPTPGRAFTKKSTFSRKSPNFDKIWWFWWVFVNFVEFWWFLVEINICHGSGAQKPLNIANIMYVFHTWLPGLALLLKILFSKLKSWNSSQKLHIWGNSWFLRNSKKFPDKATSSRDP